MPRQQHTTGTKSVSRTSPSAMKSSVKREVPVAPVVIPTRVRGDQRVQFRATLDKRTVEMMAALSTHLRLKRSTLFSELLVTLAKDKKEQTALAKFYRDQWPKLQQTRRDVGLQFNWVIDADDALRLLSWEAITNGNKSETLRVITTFYAQKHGLVGSE